MPNPIDQFPRTIVAHCIERLCDRYGVAGLAKAKSVYLTHHGQLVRGEGELLYTRGDCLVFRLESHSRYFYPVRATREDRLMTVTYLSPEQVLRNIISLYVLNEKDHDMQKR